MSVEIENTILPSFFLCSEKPPMNAPTVPRRKKKPDKHRKRPRGTAFCFTYHKHHRDPETNELIPNVPFMWNPFLVSYIIYQEEVCPETGLLHLQGYIELKKVLDVPGPVEKLVFFGNKKIHLELRKGTQEEAIEYCKKEASRAPLGEQFEWGIPKICHQGQRSDLGDMNIEIEEHLKNGENAERNVALGQHRDTVARHLSYFKMMLLTISGDINKSKLRKVETFSIWGPPGTGKSMKVWNLINSNRFFKLDAGMTRVGGTCWFDGYNGERILWIDEGIQNIDPLNALQILDIYPLQIQKKGTSAWAQWEIVFITSNFKKENWYPISVPEETRAAICRRIKEEKHAPFLGSLNNWTPTLSEDLRGILNMDFALHHTQENDRHQNVSSSYIIPYGEDVDTTPFIAEFDVDNNEGTR